MAAKVKKKKVDISIYFKEQKSNKFIRLVYIQSLVNNWNRSGSKKKSKN